MERIKQKHTGFHLLFCRIFYLILAKGQPHIHFPALTVARIKVTSVCLVLSIKRQGAPRQEMGGEREREGMWWEGYEEEL